ncbi:hypothetical protein U1Q18_035570 [Sarracenia purpurea var. burkii]
MRGSGYMRRRQGFRGYKGRQSNNRFNRRGGGRQGACFFSSVTCLSHLAYSRFDSSYFRYDSLYFKSICPTLDSIQIRPFSDSIRFHPPSDSIHPTSNSIRFTPHSIPPTPFQNTAHLPSPPNPSPPAINLTIDLHIHPHSVLTSVSSANSHHMITRSKSKLPTISHPSTSLVSSSNVPQVSKFDNIEPHTFKEAIQHPKWLHAMHDEFSALLKH